MELISAENRRKFGDDYIKILIAELRRSGKNSSGKLINSLDYRLQDSAEVLNIIFEAQDYFEVVDKGRRPGTYPPIQAIANWARTKGISQGAVFPIAKSIYRFGIKPTNINDKAEQRALNGQPFDELESNIQQNVENIVFNELNKLKEI
jgi:hypothetical protein